MRSTLFFIPHELAGIPLFGFGWCLMILAVGLLLSSLWQLRRHGSWTDVAAPLPFWLLTAAVVAWVLPNVEARWPDGAPIGLPIRGYGVMVLTGLLAGISLCVHRGRQVGVNGDTVVGLGFWMMVGGVLGARLFYVLQKWEEFDQVGLLNRLIAMVKLTEGGLVIYGGVFGGLAAGAWFCFRHKLHVASMADLVAPGFLAGYALGRVGCLLHGCCFGGVCTAEMPAITFPHGSGPYQAQLASGQLLGLTLERSKSRVSIAEVQPGSLADRGGLAVGDEIESIRLQIVEPSPDRDPTAPDALVVDLRARPTGSQRSLNMSLFPEQLPPRSLPVHPSQIYAAINAALLCGLIWLLQPLTSRDGVAFLAALLLYAVSRFVLEGIRSDEAGQLGTALSISQLIAIGTGTATIAIYLALRTRPAGRVWDWRTHGFAHQTA